MKATQTHSARLATLEQLLQTLIPAFLDPVPSRETLREWFDAARIPRFKASHHGGAVIHAQHLAGFPFKSDKIASA